MAKKILSGLLIAVSIALLLLIVFGERKLISDSVAKYERATKPDEIVCRVYSGNAINDVRIISTATGYYLFLPTGTEYVEFVNVSGNTILSCDSDVTLEFRSETGTKYDISSVEALFGEINQTAGKELFKVMASQNVSSVFIISGDSIEAIDEEWKKPHSASATIVDEGGTVLFSGALDYIAPRGNSSFSLEKKPYEIKFKKSQSLIKGSKDKEWLLLNGGYDDTLVRNAVIYNFANEYTSVKAPMGRFADLYINGEYRGNYYISQKTKSVKTNGKKEGYLLMYGEEGRTANRPFVTTSLGYDFEVISPKDTTEDDVHYIENFLNELERAATSEDGTDLETGALLEDLIDFDSWTDKFLLENIFQNVDSFVDSCYFFLETNEKEPGGKLFSGPAWDYDLTATVMFDLWNTEHVGNFYLKNQLLQNAAINELLNRKFKTSVEPYVKYRLPSDVYELFNNNRQSYEMNAILWNKTDVDSIDDFIERVEKRLEVIDKKILGNTSDHIVSFYDYEGNVIKTELVKDGDTIRDIPVCASWIAFFNGWYDIKNGEPLREGFPIFEDKDYYGVWIEVPIMIKNALMSMGVDINNLNEESVDILAEYCRSQMESLDTFETLGE